MCVSVAYAWACPIEIIVVDKIKTKRNRNIRLKERGRWETISPTPKKVHGPLAGVNTLSLLTGKVWATAHQQEGSQ
jgi:hypothetical protein